MNQSIVTPLVNRAREVVNCLLDEARKKKMPVEPDDDEFNPSEIVKNYQPTALEGNELIDALKRIAPQMTVEVIWEPDPDGEWFEENGNVRNYECWQSEVKVQIQLNGEFFDGNAYLGGTWENKGDHPSESNPNISGYLPQMIEEAIDELIKSVPAAQYQETEEELRTGEAVLAAKKFVKDQMRLSYDAQQRQHGQ